MSIKKSFFYLILIFIPFLACDNNSTNEKTTTKEIITYELLDSSRTGITFLNQVENRDQFNIFSYRNFYNGGGVGVVDINNDGLQDIIFTGNQVNNKLYLNKGNFQFEDITESAGLKGYGGWSTGVSIVDINQDGYKDIYVSNAGYEEGRNPFNELFINNGDNTFTEKAKEYGLNEPGYTTHAAFFDYDGDGDLDVYILNNSFIPVNTLNNSNKRDLYAEDWDVKEFVKGGGDKLLRNDNGQFVDVSREAGIYGSLIGFGLGVTVGDINGDHLQDIYVSNDFFERDYLYINQGNGTFSEESKKWMGHMSLASMGADLADINNDGYPEIFTTEMIPETDQLIKQKLQFENYNTYQLKLRRDFYHQYMHNALQLNTGNGSFQEIAWYAGVAQSDWSWGALMFDANMDGYNDIFVCNGVYQDVTDADFMDFFANDVVQRMVLTGKKDKMEDVLAKMPSNPQANKLFINSGNLQFNSKEHEMGMGQETFSNGAAYADLNNDGSLDVIVSNLNHLSTIYKSNAKTDSTHFLKVALAFEKPNRDAIGAKVQVYSGEKQFHRQMMPTRGFQSSVDYNLHFGLGNIQKIDSIRVIWPDKLSSLIQNPPIDTLLKINYKDETKEEGEAVTPLLKETTKQYFQQVNHDFKSHEEDHHVDFYYEGLIMRMLSKEGPTFQVIDLNKDGLDDVIMGAAKGQSSSVYFQLPNGSFKSTQLSDIENEVTAVHAFDANGDGLLDLYFGSGGNHQSENNPVFNDHLFVQTKSETFEKSKEAIPETGLNTSVVLSFDYDDDGDLDLFVGSRSVPQEYGQSPKSFLFENDGNGNFKDMTIRRAIDLDNLGMITDAKLADINQDGNQNLILVGEWMGVEIFEITGKQLKKLEKNPLQELKGWWNTVEISDLNNDGLADLVVGNRGDNFYFTATDEMPVKIWLEDFDGNGDKDKILTRTLNGRDIPLQQKGEMIGQLPGLKKQSLKYEDYGKKSIVDLMGADKIENASYKAANTFQTVVMLNKGDGDFEKVDLPFEAQFSVIHAIKAIDVNQDGNLDLILAGNEGDFKPQYGKLDANDGLVLFGDGTGEFSVVEEHKSLGINGNVRSISAININNQEHLLFGINDDKPIVLQIK
ncbi:VCBS repeat-containing protein [Marivirga harenae]|uniref:VCBS repeat-containing protein n=1 Tax=Marivirga harenae TaxID=2010992 RepID=UPI0026DEA73A|nr:VCBS repeat-containing protein [Marivirga harenae]WKV11174.1 VCBS repeat-containing protein [Marivirga harenae]|tara:strand:+ start:37590 stop:40928 length:3339 start_codon:yes stop_codon:yes gene_type:complete